MLAILLALLPVLLVTGASPTSRQLQQQQYTDVKIQSGRSGLCLTPAPKTGPSSPARLDNCAVAQTWSIIRDAPGPLTAGDLVLDAGDHVANGGSLTMEEPEEECSPGQSFWYTGDNRIAVYEQGHCLDEADGNVLQIWKCTDFNDHQVWNILE